MKPKYMIITIILLFIISILMVLFVFGENDSIYGNYGKLYINGLTGGMITVPTEKSKQVKEHTFFGK